MCPLSVRMPTAEVSQKLPTVKRNLGLHAATPVRRQGNAEAPVRREVTATQCGERAFPSGVDECARSLLVGFHRLSFRISKPP